MGLAEIQQKLHAPKNQYNKFGGYKYRNCEDILEAVKPLLGDAVLLLSDEVVEIGNKVYVKATATYKDGNNEPVIVTAYAREAESRKGMDDSQITGATSTYARKYALNGLFCIDDTKDADSPQQCEKPEQNNDNETPELTEKDVNRKHLLDWMKDAAKTEPEIYKQELANTGKKTAKDLTEQELVNLQISIKAALEKRDG